MAAMLQLPILSFCSARYLVCSIHAQLLSQLWLPNLGSLGRRVELRMTEDPSTQEMDRMLWVLAVNHDAKCFKCIEHSPTKSWYFQHGTLK